MNRQFRILSGLHHGAQAQLASDAQCVIGSDESCCVVLHDPGIASRHCVITSDAFGVSCRAIEASVTVDGRLIPRGQTANLEDFQVLRCGPVALGIGPADGDWIAVQRAVQARRAAPLDAVRSLRRFNPYVLFASVLVGMSGLLGLAYAALSDGGEEAAPTRVAAARQWLKAAAPTASELQIGADSSGAGKELLLSGYVPSSREQAALVVAAARSGFKLRTEVYVAQDMVASLSRLAQLSGIPCQAEYRGDGHVGCANTLSRNVDATKLHMLAKDVAGLKALDLRVVEPAPVAKAEPPPVPSADPAPAVRITQKFAVLMFRQQRYLVGDFGKRYREGDEFEGFRIDRIGLDQVLFERDGRQYEFYVAALGASR